jgi:hypothetical protein
VQFIESKRFQDIGEGNSLPTTENDPLAQFADNLAEFEQTSGDSDLPF